MNKGRHLDAMRAVKDVWTGMWIAAVGMAVIILVMWTASVWLGGTAGIIMAMAVLVVLVLVGTYCAVRWWNTP